jgi:RimJ/RimL family protein N-acetyltransferase
LSKEVFNTSDTEIIHAYVKHDNEISVRAFLKCGFKKTGIRDLHGHQAVDLVLAKETIT